MKVVKRAPERRVQNADTRNSNGLWLRCPNVVFDQDITMGIIWLLDISVGFLVARDKHRYTNAHITRIKTWMSGD